MNNIPEDTCGTGESFSGFFKSSSAGIANIGIIEANLPIREVRSEGEHIGKEPSISSIEAFHMSTLQHYRLAYESSSYMIPYILLDTRTKEV